MEHEIIELRARKKHKATGSKVRYLVMEVTGPDVRRAATGILHPTHELAEDEIRTLTTADPFARF